jgi:hypothetical protein
VAAIEIEDRDGGPGEGASTEWMGAKFLPMAVPMAGLSVLAGRPALADVLVTFVQEVGTSLQLLNDVFNVAEDAAQGRPTPVLRWLGVRAEEVGEAPLRAVLLGHAALDRALDEAQRRAVSAAELARAHGLPQTAAVAERVRGMVAAAPGRLLRILLGAPLT